jgi:hypothetical protein
MFKLLTSPLLKRSLQLWVLLFGHVFATSFLRDLGKGLDQIDDAQVKEMARLIKVGFQTYSHWMLPPGLALIAFIQIQLIRNKPIQWGIDIFGGLLGLRCAAQFVMLNLLLLSHLKAGGLLLLQLILYIPVITIFFGWLYWRIDSAARARGKSHIKFSSEMGDLDPFDYFHISAMTLLQFEQSGASATSRLMKTLFVIHGVMMLDLVALTLSRAIGLATGG